MPPNFLWIDMYMGSKVKDVNPFVTDIFDPLATNDKLNGTYEVAFMRNLVLLACEMH
jgi:hypothetical protein